MKNHQGAHGDTAGVLRLWTGRLPKSELNGLILANSTKLSPQGYLSKDSIDIAIKLSIPFASIQTIDDEEEHLQSLRQANALFTYAQRTVCIIFTMFYYSKTKQYNLTNLVNSL